MITIQTPILKISTPTIPIIKGKNVIGAAVSIKALKGEGMQNITFEPIFFGSYKRKFMSDKFLFKFSISHSGERFESINVSINLIK
jgi:hypothetical protein